MGCPVLESTTPFVFLKLCLGRGVPTGDSRGLSGPAFLGVDVLRTPGNTTGNATSFGGLLPWSC
eukprot:6974939-Karenia_brevis.AAC.1